MKSGSAGLMAELRILRWMMAAVLALEIATFVGLYFPERAGHHVNDDPPPPGMLSTAPNCRDRPR